MQTVFIVLGVLVVAFLFLFFMAKWKMKNIPEVADSEKIITLTDKNFNQQIKKGIILVDFWASWCVPCKMMAPVLNELSEQLADDKLVGKLNVEQYQAIATAYKIRGIPTMILFKNGTEITRFVGMKSKDFLLKELNI